MNRKKLMSFDDNKWDAHRLIWAIAELRNEDSNALYENCENFIVKVHQQRIYSVLCALYNLEYKEEDMYSTIRKFVEGKFLPRISVDEFKHLAKYYSGDKCYRIDVKDEKTASIYLKNLFNQLMDERLASERFICRNQGMLCGTPGHHVAIKYSDRVFIWIKEANWTLENSIKSFLCDKGRFSLTENELIEKYHYPETTDGELLDNLIDNF